MIQLDPGLVTAARAGDRSALDALVRAIERPILNLAVRMTAHRSDAEDAAQEIVIKIVTHLGALRSPDAAGAWALRIAIRHLVGERKASRVEAMRLDFHAFAADLDDGLAEPGPERTADPDFPVLLRQVKIGCTLALLTCLSRPLRAAYVLGEIFELSETEAAAALELDAAAFRQRLKRARDQVLAFMQAHCGVVTAAAPCRCARRVETALGRGRIAARAPEDEAQSLSLAAIEAQIAHWETERAAHFMHRSNPEFQSAIAEAVLATL